MSLLERKRCAICGKRIALTDGIELQDGSMCGKCAARLSPWLSSKQQLSAGQMRQHLAYREENRRRVAAFHATREFGSSARLLLDDGSRQFVIASSTDWRSANPDVVSFSQIRGCSVSVLENRTELMRLDESGLSKPYEPPRYDIDFDFRLAILVDSPWFSSMGLRVNDAPVKQRGSVEYNRCLQQANEMREALGHATEEARD